MADLEQANSKTVGESLIPLKTALSRYLAVSWAPAIAITLLMCALAILLPSYYVSDAIIAIKPQQLSSKLVKPPTEKEQKAEFDALIHELLARPRLRKVIESFGLYPKYKGVQGKEKALNKFRQNIVVEQVMSNTGKPNDRIFRLAFTHKNKNTAYEVTKSLSNLFIEEGSSGTKICLLYTSPSPRDATLSRMPSSA